MEVYNKVFKRLVAIDGILPAATEAAKNRSDSIPKEPAIPGWGPELISHAFKSA